MLEAAAAALGEVQHYPSPRAEPLRDLLSARLGVPVVVGNGANELLFAACAGMETAHVGGPAYGGYAEAAQAAGARVVVDPAAAAVRFWGRPNNPDGSLASVAEIWAWCARHPTQRVVVDESFLALTDTPSCLAPHGPENLVVVTSLTKTYAIPGLRLGYAAGRGVGALAERIPMWSVNGPALAAGLVAVNSGAWLDQAREEISRWRGQQARALEGLPGVVGVQGAANFQLVTLSQPVVSSVRVALEVQHRVLIRDCSTYTGLDGHHMRVAVRAPPEQARLLAALDATLPGRLR